MVSLDGLHACGWGVASLDAAQLADVQRAAASHGHGAAVVASCQRIEVFSLEPCECDAPRRWEGFDALLRLAEIAAGLDSIVLGEAQILGQVRSAVSVAEPSLQQTLALAVSAARSFRSEVTFGTHTGHLLDRALSVARMDAGGGIVVAGAGAAGRLVAERALALGFDHVTVASRREPSESWFVGSRMQWVPLDALAGLPATRVLVTCLGSTARPMSAAELPTVSGLVVDLGTPRNVVAGSGFGVQVLAIADLLHDGVDRPHADARRGAMRARLRALLERRIADAGNDAQAPVGRLRDSVERIRRSEAERIHRIHPEIPPETVEIITRSLVNQLFHRPTHRLRVRNDPQLGAAVAELFAQEPATESPA
jgi:glutamyl-tRNA reductase